MDQPQKRNGRAPRWDNPFPSENDSQSESASGRIVDHNPSERSSHLKSSHLNLLSSVDSEELSQNADDQLTPENMSLLLKAIQKRKMAHQAASSPRSTEKETLCGAGGHGPTVKKKVIDYGHKSKYEGPKGNARSSTIAVDDSVEKFQTRQAASVPAVPAVLISRPKNTSEELIRQVEPRARTPNPQAIPLVDPASKTPGLFPPPAGPRVPAAVPAVMLPVVPPMTLVPPVAQPVVQPAVDQPRVPSAPPLLEIESTNDKYLQAPWADPPNRTGQTTGGQKNAQKEPQDRFESPFGVVKASWLPVFSNTDAQKTRELPDPSQMNDYYAVTPRVFPRICSLCNEVCKDKVDWIQHQNSVVHIGNCQKLRVQYPNWHPEVSSPSKRCKGDGEERHTSRRRCASPSPKRSRCSSSSHYRHGTQSPSRSSGHTRCRTRSRSRSSGYTRRRTRSRSRSSGHTRRRSRSRSRSSGHTKHQTQSPSRSSGHTRRQTRSRSRSCGHTKRQTQSPSRSSGHTRRQTRSRSRSSGHTKRQTQSPSRSSGHTKHQTRSPSRSSGHTRRRTRSRSRSSGHTKHQTWSPSRSSGHTRRQTRSRSRSSGHTKHQTQSPSRSSGHTKHQTWSPSRSSGHTRRQTRSRSRSSGHTKHQTQSPSRSSGHTRRQTRSRSRSSGHTKHQTQSPSRNSGRTKHQTRSPSRSSGHTKHRTRSRSRSSGHTKHQTRSPSRNSGRTKHQTWSPLRSSDYTRHRTRSRSRSPGSHRQSRPRSRSPWRFPSPRPRSMSPWRPLDSSRCSCTSSSLERELENSRRSPERQHTWTPHSENRYDERKRTHSSSNYQEKRREDLEWTQEGSPRQKLFIGTGRQEQERSRLVPRERRRDDPEPSALASLTEKSVLQAMAQLQAQGGAGRRLHRGRDSTHLAAGRTDTPAVPSDLVSMIQLVTTQVIEAVWDSKEASSRRPSASEDGRSRQQGYSAARKAKNPSMASSSLQQATSTSSNVVVPDTHQGNAKSIKGKTKKEGSPCPKKDISQSDTAKDKHVAGRCPKKESSSSGKAKDKNVADLCPEKESSSSGKAKDKNVASLCPKKESSSSGKAKDKNVVGLCPKKESSSSGKAKDKNVASLCPRKDSSSSGKAKDKNVVGLCPEKDSSSSGKAKDKNVASMCPEKESSSSGKAKDKNVVGLCPEKESSSNGKAKDKNVVSMCPEKESSSSGKAKDKNVVGLCPEKESSSSGKAKDKNVASLCPRKDSSSSGKAKDKNVAGLCPEKDSSSSGKAKDKNVAGLCPKKDTSLKGKVKKKRVADPCPQQGTAVSGEAEKQPIEAHSSHHGTADNGKAENQCVVDACTHQGITASMEEENQHVLDQWPPQDMAPSDKAASENAIGPSSQQDTIASSKTEDLHVAAPSPQEDTSVSSEAENPGAASPSLNEGTAGNATAENLHVASPSPNEATAVSAETESKCLVALSSQEGSDLSSKAGSQETEQELVPGAATGTGHHLGSPGRVSKPRVQICGDSLVVSAQKRASLTTEGWQLGLEESLVLEWHGQEEMTWTWLLPLFQNLAAQGQAPNALILHLGGNDLVPAFDSSSFSTVKRAFSLLRELLPQVRVIWSEVIPQGIWHGGERDRQRKKLNTDVGKCVKSHGGAVIKHPRISSEDTELYMDKANLSDAGIDIFLEDIKNGILAHVLQSSGVAGGGLKKGTNLAPLAPSVTSSGLVSVNEKVAIQEEGAVSSSEEVLRTRTGAREGAASSQLVSGKARNSGVASPGPHPGTSGSHEVKNQEPRAEQHLEVASVPASSVPADLPSVSQEAATGEDEAVSSSEEASDTQANQGEGAVNSQPVSSRAENSGAASPSPKAGVSGRSKAENQDEEQELVVGNVPPCSGNPGQASKLRVWICGQSVIISAQKQASSTTAGSQLGLETILLEWHGQEEMAWPQLVPALQKLAAQGQAPDGLIVHLGENDLLCSRGGQLSCTIKQELGLVKELFPQVRILWSNLLLRRRGFGKCGSRTVNRARGMVNLEVGQFIGSLGGAVIEHPAILHTVPDFYADGDSLSCDGLDIFLQDIKNGILAHFPS
ncbi:serine/arginine repetitive matrix protein 2-like isoform X2 [Eublepharis macularius]|uniref:Serine/arginine repetitive matrix protein 2-like isoform X2 n=1 Tax=Eublepharis macularius TaxID=481883 RepID=A0AA97JZH8_EUBMA|nr:serine/arginine repetitive matrix protein 2-like isoform X2 [Eublepharis macularius]